MKRLTGMRMMKKKKVKKKEPEIFIRASVTLETKNMIVTMARKLGVSQAVLCGMWVSQFNPNDEMLVEKIRHAKAKAEVDRLTKTRISLMAQLRTKGIMQELVDLDNSDLNMMLHKIKNRLNK